MSDKNKKTFVKRCIDCASALKCVGAPKGTCAWMKNETLFVCTNAQCAFEYRAVFTSASEFPVRSYWSDEPNGECIFFKQINTACGASKKHSRG